MVTELVDSTTTLILVINKIDLSENLEKLRMQLSKKYQKEYSSIHFVSALTSEGVQELFIDCARRVLAVVNSSTHNVTMSQEMQTNRKFGCC